MIFIYYLFSRQLVESPDPEGQLRFVTHRRNVLLKNDMCYNECLTRMTCLNNWKKF